MILLEDLNVQMIVSTNQLPKNSKESMYLNIFFQEDEVLIQSINHEKTFKEWIKAKRLREQLMEQRKKNQYRLLFESLINL